MRTQSWPTPEAIADKRRAGVTLTAWETSVYRLNYRDDGTRYSSDPTERAAQYDADNIAERDRFLMAAKRLRENRGGRPTTTLENGRFVFTYPDGTITRSGI